MQCGTEATPRPQAEHLGAELTAGYRWHQRQQRRGQVAFALALGAGVLARGLTLAPLRAAPAAVALLAALAAAGIGLRRFFPRGARWLPSGALRLDDERLVIASDRGEIVVQRSELRSGHLQPGGLGQEQADWRKSRLVLGLRSGDRLEVALPCDEEAAALLRELRLDAAQCAAEFSIVERPRRARGLREAIAIYLAIVLGIPALLELTFGHFMGFWSLTGPALSAYVKLLLVALLLGGVARVDHPREHPLRVGLDGLLVGGPGGFFLAWSRLSRWSRSPHGVKLVRHSQLPAELLLPQAGLLPPNGRSSQSVSAAAPREGLLKRILDARHAAPREAHDEGLLDALRGQPPGQAALAAGGGLPYRQGHGGDEALEQIVLDGACVPRVRVAAAQALARGGRGAARVERLARLVAEPSVREALSRPRLEQLRGSSGQPPQAAWAAADNGGCATLARSRGCVGPLPPTRGSGKKPAQRVSSRSRAPRAACC